MLKSQSGITVRSSLFGTRLSISRSTTASSITRPITSPIVAESPYGERFRLHNLSPQEGSRKKKTRKGRGHSAGQGGSCGFGMRGQKARSGRSVKPGFEGGQTPLYRRLPKLRGIAGGMPAGKTNFVTINLSTISEKFNEGDVVDLDILKERKIIKASGKMKNLPLKVLGEGTIEKSIEIKAAQFSKSAKQKIEEAGGSPVVIPMKPKWTQERYEQMVAEGKIIPRKTKRYYYLKSIGALDAPPAAEESEAPKEEVQVESPDEQQEEPVPEEDQEDSS